MKKIALFCLLAASTAAPQEKQDPLAGDPALPNYRRISAEIATAGQPSDEGLAKLKEAGFKTILNLRPPEEGSLEEQKKVESLGLQYVNIPITADTITDEKVRKFSEAVSDSGNKPLLIHCSRANRVGGLWYIHRTLADRIKPEKSLAEAKEIGLSSPILEEIVRRYTEEKTKP